MAEKIKIAFLGTGSAIPTARRNHPAMYLQYKNENILFDCGEGTQRQFRKAKLNPCRITKILISHWHADHVLGLPGLLQTLVLNGFTRQIDIYGPSGTKRKLGMYMDMFVHRDSEIKINVHEVKDEKIFENDEFYIETKSMDHEIATNAYSFVVKSKKRLNKAKLAKLKLPNSPLLGKLISGKVVEIGGKKIDGKKLIYSEPERKVSFILDTRTNDNAVKLAKGADILISEATFSEEDKELTKQIAHMTSGDAARIAKKAKVKKLMLMHLSQRYEAIPKIILGEAKKIFKDVSIPEDLDRIEF